MAIRKRMINPTIWDDPEYNSLSLGGRVLFIGLISNADDEGRLRGGAGFISKTIFGYDNLTIKQAEKYRNEVVKKMANVCLYKVDGEDFIQLLNWNRHQRLKTDRIVPSEFPKPDGIISNIEVLEKIIDDRSVRGNLPIRIEVAERDGGCRYCGKKFPHDDENFILEHIIPESQGGKTDLDNCVLACASCNTIKGSRTPEQANMKLIAISEMETIWFQSGSKVEPKVKGREVKGSKGNRSKVKGKAADSKKDETDNGRRAKEELKRTNLKAYKKMYGD